MDEPRKTLVRPDVEAARDAERTVVREDAQGTLVRPAGDATPTVLHPAAPGSDEGPVTPEAEGRYELRGEYGRGGQSRVMLAFDRHIGREIALKEILPDGEGTGSSGSQAAAGRFVREARITGQLEHPNIVPVYELGAHPDGTRYYTQKLVRGTTLRKKLDEASSLAGRLELLSHFSDICHAVAYAHSRGVVHRDLKPENVMIGQFGETVVLDWGLAKARGQKDVRGKEVVKEAELMRSPDATLAGHALGTPSYMSPEQALGKLEEIDERSDVWSLGAILFQILTGHPPYDGETAYSVIRKVIAEPPPRVREVLKEAPPELAAVAERALQRDRNARYESAEAVAREIEAYQSGGDVRAYRYSSWELLRRFVLRHRALTAVSALALLLLLVALVAIHDESRRAKVALAAARHNLAQAFLEKARSAERDFFWHRAEIFYAAARVQEDSPQARWGAVVEGEDAAGVTRIAGPDGWVVSTVFSPDGKTVAASGMDGGVRLFDLATGRELFRFVAPGPVKSVAVSPDGSAIASRDFTGTVRVHDRSGSLLGSFECHGTGKGSLAFAAGRLFASCPDHTLSFELTTRKVSALPFPSQRLARCDGKLLYANEDELRIDGGARIPAPSGKHEIACGGGLVAVSDDREIQLFHATGAAAGTIHGHDEKVAHLAVSADGKLIASASLDRTVRLWDARTLRPVASLQRPAPAVWVDFSPDGRQLAVGEQQNALLLWDIARGPPAQFDPAPATARALKAQAAPGGIDLLDAKTGAKVRQLKFEGAEPQSMAFSPQGALLAAAGQDAAVHLYELTGGSEVAHLIVAGATQVSALQFSRDGRLLHLHADGATSGAVRYLRIGDPSSLAEPAAALKAVLDDHGVDLENGELEPRAPPVTVPAPPR